MEIAGRVYDTRCFTLMNNKDLTTFKRYMKKCFGHVTQIRNQDSAVVCVRLNSVCRITLYSPNTSTLQLSKML